MSEIQKIRMYDRKKYDVNIKAGFEKEYWDRYIQGQNTFAEVLYLQLIREYYE